MVGHMRQGIIERYRSFMPVNDITPVVSLLEGSTPLIAAPRISKWISPYVEVYLKFDGMNPTGSFKDRGMTMAISKAAEVGAKAVICASTGNTSASAAAYAARAGMKCFVLLPKGKVALGKLSQALMHGARALAVEGNFDEALDIVREIGDKYPVTIVNSTNPFRGIGQRSASFEIVDDLGDAPHYHALPVGNARNIVAYWEGFQVYHEAGKSTRLPKMLGFQAAGSAPIVDGHVIEHPETIATAIRIGNPASWKQAESARDTSGGLIDKITDEQILEAYQQVAALEGVFCEPASAAPLAGLKMLADRGFFTEHAVITATLTGHGLKDPDTAMSCCDGAFQKVPATFDAVRKALELD